MESEVHNIDCLDQKKAAVERVAVVEKPFVARTGSETPTDTTGTTTPTTPANGDDPNAGND